MQVETTDFLVDLADVNRTKIRSSHCSTTEGNVLVKVEQFAFTANNMTYALIGGATGWYWDFFPAPRGWGRIPVWGFGKVVASEIGNVETGEELFGYFPMSTHVLLKPGKIRSDGLHDASEHRAHLSPVYNYYVRTLANPAFDSRSKREIMLLRPLFFASFLVHDLLAERVAADANCAPTNVGRAPASPKTEGRKRKLGRKSRGAFSVSLYSVTTRRKTRKNAVECGFVLRVLPNSTLADD